MYYRTYRPQKISDLDNEKIRETLGKALLSGSFTHAYLLTGPRGVGKTTVARLIAKTVNCQRRKQGEEPCNKCESCLSITEGRSLDVLEIDAASNTSVDDIRDLREKAKLAPTNSPYKVYIIDEVHMLSNSAFNALLKILEEPPRHVIFVLATTDPQKLPETVISRCQRYDFGRATVEEIAHAVKRAARGEDLDVENEVIKEIASLADGSLRDGHKILEQLASQNKKITLNSALALKSVASERELVAFLRFLEQKDAGKALDWLAAFSQAGGRMKALVEGSVQLLRRELLSRFSGETKKPEFSFTPPEIAGLLSALEKANLELRDTIVPTLPIELLIVEWCGREIGDGQLAASNTQGEEEKNAKITVVESEEKKAAAVDKGGLPVVSVLSEDQWKELLVKLKPVNHSLVAFMRAGHPAGNFGSSGLVIEVAYKFHLEKLSEEKNRRAVEEAVSAIIGQPMKVKFILATKK